MARKSAAAETASSPSLGLDDAPPADLALTPSPPRGSQGDDGRPFCPLHICLMTAVSSAEKATYYACPVPNCKCTAKRARPIARIPAQPRHCPEKICTDNPASFLQVDPRRSSGLAYTLVCPTCGYHQPEPNPLAHLIHRREQEFQARDAQADNIGER